MINRGTSKLLSVLLVLTLLVGAVPVNLAGAGGGGVPVDIGVELDTTQNTAAFVSEANSQLQELYLVRQEDFSFPLSTQDGSPKIYKIFKKSTSEEYGYIFAYGNPHGKIQGGVHRHIGYTAVGGEYANIGFPHDDYRGWTFPEIMPTYQGRKSTIIEEPWEDEEVKEKYNIDPIIDETFYRNQDAIERLNKQIKLGVKIAQPSFVGDEGAFDQIQWEKYVHIELTLPQFDGHDKWLV